MKHIKDHEKDSFIDLDKNKSSRRVSVDGPVEVEGTVEGSFAPSGLKNGGRITVVGVNSSTWTKIPPVPLENRNAISIQNYSDLEIKINYSDSVGGYVGIVVPDKGERFYDITDSIELYAKCETGNGFITIEEIA